GPRRGDAEVVAREVDRRPGHGPPQKDQDEEVGERGDAPAQLDDAGAPRQPDRERIDRGDVEEGEVHRTNCRARANGPSSPRSISRAIRSTASRCGAMWASFAFRTGIQTLASLSASR